MFKQTWVIALFFVIESAPNKRPITQKNSATLSLSAAVVRGVCKLQVINHRLCTIFLDSSSESSEGRSQMRSVHLLLKRDKTAESSAQFITSYNDEKPFRNSASLFYCIPWKCTDWNTKPNKVWSKFARIIWTSIMEQRFKKRHILCNLSVIDLFVLNIEVTWFNSPWLGIINSSKKFNQLCL